MELGWPTEYRISRGRVRHTPLLFLCWKRSNAASVEENDTVCLLPLGGLIGPAARAVGTLVGLCLLRGINGVGSTQVLYIMYHASASL
ncbi:hypothetical protein BC827DRAFT_1169916 [Russula dissimulans]|nr:hypothetical protein BC827DRAFT_1169916 [Russula dissimulans]